MLSFQFYPRIRATMTVILGVALASCKAGPTSPEPPTFALSSTSVILSNTNEQHVTITNLGSDPIDWRVLASTASWLTATPGSGSLEPHGNSTLKVQIDRAAVSQGNHSASLQIGAGGYATVLDVTVEQATFAKAALEPSTLAIPLTETSRVVEVVNTGNSSLQWTLAGPAWAALTPSTGNLAAGRRTQVVVTPQRSELTGGQYVGTLQLTSNGGPATASLTVDVAEATKLRLEPATLDFGTSTSNLSLRVVNDSDQSLDWSAQASGPWITLSSSSGRLPPGLNQLLTVDVTRSGLSQGTNQAAILFTANDGSTSANVMATVVPAGTPNPPPTTAPEINVTPVSLDFGQTATELTFLIHNGGDEPLDWTAQPGASWISLPVSTGRVSAHANTPVTVRVLRAGLTAGTYQSTVRFTSPGGSVTTSVMASVPSSTTPPPTAPPPTTPPPTTPPPTTPPPPAPAKISVSPTILDFGLAGTELSFKIQNTGGSALAWSAQSTHGWATMPVYVGNVAAGVSQDVTARVSRTGLLAAGSYQASIQLTSNGGGAIVSLSLQVAAQPPPPPSPSGSVNVRDFGALGNGQANDTGAFDAALAALGSSGGVLYVPAGTYVLTPKTGVPDRALDLSNRSYITISGDGLDNTTIKMAPGTYVQAGDTHIAFLYRSIGITIRDLALDGNRLNASFIDEQSHCVKVDSSSDVRFERVFFHHCRGDGVLMLGAGSSGDPWTDRVTIQDSRFQDNGRSGIAVSRAVRNLNILRNTFERIGSKSISIEPTGTTSPTDILIEGNVIRHSRTSYAVGIGGIGGTDIAQRFTFRNNLVENGAVQVSKANAVIIENNVIRGDSYHSPLRISHNTTNVQIVGNQITSSGIEEDSAGIQIVALNGLFPSNITVRGNTVNTNNLGILVWDALSNVVIDGNDIDGEGTASGVLVANSTVLNSNHPNFSIIGNTVQDFTYGVVFGTSGDAFSGVVITENTFDHSQNPPTSTIAILFDKTTPHEKFAVVVPNYYGSGIKTNIALWNN